MQNYRCQREQVSMASCLIERRNSLGAGTPRVTAGDVTSLALKKVMLVDGLGFLVSVCFHVQEEV